MIRSHFANPHFPPGPAPWPGAQGSPPPLRGVCSVVRPGPHPPSALLRGRCQGTLSRPSCRVSDAVSQGHASRPSMDLNVNLEKTVKVKCYSEESSSESLCTQTLPHRYGDLFQSLIRGALCSGRRQEDKRPVRDHDKKNDPLLMRIKILKEKYTFLGFALFTAI